jgi:hypothetical protein
MADPAEAAQTGADPVDSDGETRHPTSGRCARTSRSSEGGVPCLIDPRCHRPVEAPRPSTPADPSRAVAAAPHPPVLPIERRPVIRLRTGALLLAIAAACSDESAQLTTKMASDFQPAGHAVSVLGVYQDGRMTSSAWERLAPSLQKALGGGACELGYDGWTSSNAVLADAIDERARDDGPTDELLTQLRPAAEGDAILVLTLSGAVPHETTVDGGVPAQRAAVPGGGRGGGRGMRGGARPRGVPPPPETPRDVLDLSATLYSVAAGHSVAVVELQYSGTSMEDALRRFAAEVAHSLPQMKCAGWKWNSTIDPEQIRRGVSE